MIQLAGLLEKARLLETFQIELGRDLQKDITMKEPMAALFKAFLVLDEMVKSEEVNLKVWSLQGLEALAKKPEKNNHSKIKQNHKAR